ncbi:MAG: hypothetical protein GY756_14255 [bacterium]|nr:hypothetical protein [bacterium]
MAEKSSIINSFLYPEYTAPLDYMMERRIDNDNSISNLVDMEYNLLRRFQSLLSFPLNKINNYNSSLTYNDFYYAREIFRLMQSSNFNNKHALFYDWVKAVKHFSSNMIEANYFNSETPLVLQHWSEHNKDIDEPASDIFVAMKYVSNNRSFEPVIMRGSKNLKFGAMSNINPNSEPSLMFYKTFENLYKNEPEAVVKLPTYWTPLYLLFDGPPERPNDWKYKYWGTWKAAVRISNNLWMSKILIKGYNSVYSLYITFELDDKIAESLKKLEAISSKFNKSQLFTEIGKDPELNNNENLNKNNSNSNKAGKKVKKTEFDKRDITKAENLDLTTNKP